MSAGIELLDKYVAACKHPSDSATARALKIRPSAVNNWRHGRSHPDILSVQRMCDAINEPLIKWVPLIEADRATTPGNKRVWLQLAENAKSFAAVVAITIGLAVHTAKSEPLHATYTSLTESSPIYIMRRMYI